METVDNPNAVSVMEPTEVAKKKSKPEPEPAKTLFSIKGDQAWYDWLKRYAGSLGLSVTVAIDVALREQARRDKFDEPMPKRFGR